MAGAKDEYAERLVHVLRPQMHAGFRDIFNEAVGVCSKAGEPHKYLMTFQNFLAKVPTWSEATVESETKRIQSASGCDYMPELVACVHVAHLKLLTSIRPSNSSREVELPVPSLTAFVHKAYVVAARKLWQSTFLFETGVMPLEQQKNAREVEGIIRESIIEAVRDSLPVDDILKNYLKGEEETVLEPLPLDKPSLGSASLASTPVVLETREAPISEAPISEAPIGGAPISEAPISEAPISTAPISEASVLAPSVVALTAKPLSGGLSNPAEILAIGLSGQKGGGTIGFTDSDRVLDLGTNESAEVSAPKDVASLEAKKTPLHGAPLPPEEDDEDGALTLGATVPGAIEGLIEVL